MGMIFICSSGDRLLASVSFHFELFPNDAAVHLQTKIPGRVCELVLLGTYPEMGRLGRRVGICVALMDGCQFSSDFTNGHVHWQGGAAVLATPITSAWPCEDVSSPEFELWVPCNFGKNPSRLSFIVVVLFGN